MIYYHKIIYFKAQNEEESIMVKVIPEDEGKKKHDLLNDFKKKIEKSE